MSEIKRISIKTLGCRLNQSESDAIQNSLDQAGFTIVDDHNEADVTLINSCAVTVQAEAKTRGAIAAARRISPNGKIIVIGCYPQENAERVLEIPGVDLVLGNQEKYKVPEYLSILQNPAEYHSFVGDINHGDEPSKYTFTNSDGASAGSMTRAYVKVQDGCNYFCSYCIIPYLRGRSRSRNFDECIDEINQLHEKGFREIVLSGINLGTYQYENVDLTGLLKMILEKTGIPRIRLSSIEPNLITDEMIELMADEPRICRHLHVPLQHGSDEILKAMHRKYDTDFFRRKIEAIHKKIPGVCIGTDVLVGYPGESEQNFDEMAYLIKSLPLSYLHVFRYSRRPGTVAAKQKDDIHPEIKKKRAQKLRSLGARKKTKFIAQFLKQKMSVLFEKIDKNGYYTGHTDNYIEIRVKHTQNLTNQIAEVVVNRAFGTYAEGETAVGK